MPTETAIRLTFDPAWSWLAIGLVALALVAIVWWSYRPKIAHLSPWRRRLLLGFRFSLIALLLLMLLRPELRYTENDDSDATILILADQSRSMTVPDMPGGLTRRAALAKLLADNAEQLGSFGEKLQVRYMEFAENAPTSGRGDANRHRAVPRAGHGAAGVRSHRGGGHAFRWR